jgi:hypothetical protein
MSNRSNGRNGVSGFRRGDWVAVRSLAEILATLDADAKLDGLPFIPEMADCCDKTFRVCRRAEKTCVEGIGMRNMRGTVFLDGLRCDGSAHGGCQRACMFFWKEAWLRPAEEERSAAGSGQSAVMAPAPYFRSPSELPTVKGDRYYCQSTELGGATGEFSPGKWRHLLHDVRIGELTLRRFGYVLGMAVVNRVWRLLHGRRFFEIAGAQKTTANEELNLRPGEWVEIKSAAEIAATLDAKGRNRGLSFDPEMARHCGRRYRVAAPVRTIIAEESGRMVQLSHTVILEGLVCQGICMLNCPRANYFYWREIWLNRVV